MSSKRESEGLRLAVSEVLLFRLEGAGHTDPANETTKFIAQFCYVFT